MDAVRVLVADDDSAMVELLCEQLGSWGYAAVSAAGLERALQLLDAGPFQIVLGDVHMPAGGGFELLAAIRARWPATAVVLMSAFPAPETAKHALEAGAKAFLSKPFSMADLRGALRRSAPRPGGRANAPPH